jgi:hypothetical protein
MWDYGTWFLVLTLIGVVLLVGTIMAIERQSDRDARQRSEQVLRTHLSTAELAGLNRQGYLEVASPSRAGRAYLVSPSASRVVVVQNGVPVSRLCIHPVVRLPGREEVLAHKLMLQTDEADYLRRANVVWYTRETTPTLGEPDATGES